jgi:hypothetical protein
MAISSFQIANLKLLWYFDFQHFKKKPIKIKQKHLIFNSMSTILKRNPENKKPHKSCL